MVVFIVGVLLMTLFESLLVKSLLALAISGALVSVVGFIDDKKGLRASIRFCVHTIAAITLLYMIKLPESLLTNNLIFDSTIYIFICISLVWLLNLFNFMDGIDGIASCEALISSVIIAICLYFYADATAIVFICLLFAASMAGFLVLNFPPAKIFMGDVGSGFVGIIIGGLMLISAEIDTKFLMAWLIILGVFMTDATITLITRLLKGHKPNEAHNLHVYQKLSRQFDSHKKVTGLVCLINLVWLAPLAMIVSAGVLNQIVGLVIAYIPLIVVGFYCKAGIKEETYS